MSTLAWQNGRAVAHEDPRVELERLRALVSGSTDMLSRHSPEGVYLYASPSCRELLGYEPEELVGRSAYELFHPTDVVAITDSHEAVLDRPGLSSVVYRIRHKDGHWVWFETTSHTIRDRSTGEVIEIQTSSRDVTRRIAAEQQLAESERRFRLAMANAPIGMAVVGLDGSFVEVNERLCRILGRTATELERLTFQDITHPDDLDADLGYAEQLVTGEIDRYSLEKRYFHADGHVVWALLAGSVVRDQDGAPQYFIAQIEDISERKRYESELERVNAELAASNADLQSFAAVASHDLRSPLATLSGLLDLVVLRYGDELSDDARDWIDRARKHSTRLGESVASLLELAKIGRGELNVEPVDVGRVIAEVLEDLEPELEAAEATVDVSRLPPVLADRAQTRLLFQNLISNAVRFRAPERPLVVRIDAHRSDAGVRIDVEDNGSGFDPADREVIFEPFGRTATGEKLEGHGIGLATCKRIVERHGGTIEADPLDPGARFTLTLPAAADGPG